MPSHGNPHPADTCKHRKHTLPERSYSFSLQHSFFRLAQATKTMLLGYTLENSSRILTMSVLWRINNYSNTHDPHNKRTRLPFCKANYREPRFSRNVNTQFDITCVLAEFVYDTIIVHFFMPKQAREIFKTCLKFHR